MRASVVHSQDVDSADAVAELLADAKWPGIAAPRVDLQSVHALGQLAAELTAAGVRLQAVEARSSVRERFRDEGLDAQLGGIDRFTSVADVVDAFQKQTTT
jgi:MFS superfamily sulfate permease-like transporter